VVRERYLLSAYLKRHIKERSMIDWSVAPGAAGARRAYFTRPLLNLHQPSPPQREPEPEPESEPEPVGDPPVPPPYRPEPVEVPPGTPPEIEPRLRSARLRSARLRSGMGAVVRFAVTRGGDVSTGGHL
jgi:hypothetical protein